MQDSLLLDVPFRAEDAFLFAADAERVEAEVFANITSGQLDIIASYNHIDEINDIVFY